VPIPKPKPHWWDELAARIAADPDWYAKYVAAEAARGNPYPLIGRLSNVTQLSDAEIRSTIAALRATSGKETNRYLRLVEQKLIAIAVDRMIDDDKAPLTQKQAIAKVSKGRGRSTSHIKAAVAAHGKKRYHTR
jgi:hypothetical protein